MKNSRLILLGLGLGLGLCSFTLQAQDLPIPQQAETGTVGADWNTLDDAAVRYVSVRPTSTINSQNPGTPARIITYSVTFPAAGSYSLYARVRVGPAGANDDSFYYGNGFGTKSPTNDNDWITVNGLNVAGFTAPTDVVTGAGTATTGVWKWINLSRLNLVNSGSESPIRFTVNANTLTQTIQIGAREDGLDIDQLAFGTSNTTFTVDNLNLGQAGITPPPPPPYTPTGPPLATGKSKYFGGIWSPAQLTNFTNYWNLVVPSNAGKWGSVEGTRDVMNWTNLDAAYRLAKDNGFPFRFHVLIWGNQQPAWIETLPPAEQLEEIKEWFAAVAQRYPDIDMLEVVNEPLHDPPGTAGNGGGNYVNALGGNGATGWDWVINAFKLAREYFPNTRLMLNDYSVENSVASATSYRNIITLLQQRQLIDAIGIQGHSFSTRPTSSAVLRSSLDVLAATGLPLYITELDVNGTEDDTQLSEYQRIFPIFWEHPAVKGVSHFGWLPGADAEAYLAYANGAERPALVWLKDYVRNTVLPCNISTTARITNSFSSGGNDGAINLTAQGGGTATYTYNWTGPNGFTATTEDLVGVAPGTYTVTVTAPNSNCSTTSSFNVSTFRLNAGGGTISTSLGAFAADQSYSANSATATTTAAIAGTDDDALYQTERYSTDGQLRYAVPVANGQYNVVLHFAETYWTQAGQRVFNIGLEGRTVRTNYDIVAKVGPLTATTETFQVQVIDGVLNLDLVVPYLSGGRDQAKLSALEILPQQSEYRFNAGGPTVTTAYGSTLR